MPRPLLSAALALSAMALAGPARAEVHEVRSDGFIVRHTVVVAKPPMATWLALTKPGDWWSDEHTWSGKAKNMTLTPQAGGCFCETIPGQDDKGGFELAGSVVHGTVIQSNPLKLLRLEAGLGPLQSEPARGILTLALKEVEGGTQVQLEYNVGGSMRYKPAELAPIVDKVLGQQLALLGKHLGIAGKPAKDVPKDEAQSVAGEDPSIEAQIDSLGKDD